MHPIQTFIRWGIALVLGAANIASGDPRPAVFDTALVLKKRPDSNCYPQTFSLSAGDVNSDGHADVVASTCSTTLLFLGNGDGTFQPEQSIPLPSPGGVIVKDFDHDGGDELLVGTDSGPVLYRRLPGTDWVPVAAWLTDTPMHMIAADLNQDGVADIAWTTIDGSGFSVHVVLSNANGWATAADIIGHSDAGWLTVGDVDGDRLLDLSAGPQVFRNRLDRFEPQPTRATNPLLVASLDLDGNGVADQVWQEVTPIQSGMSLLSGGQGTSANTLSVRLNGSSDVACRTMLSIESPGEAEPTFWATNPRPDRYVVATGDFDGDGMIDMIVGSSVGYGSPTTAVNGRISFVRNLGNGQIVEAASFSAIGWMTRAMAVADFDEDGLPDLASITEGSIVQFTTNPSLSEVAGRFITIHMGDRTSGLRGVQAFGLSVLNNGISLPVACDINSDGMPDLAWKESNVGSASRLQVRINAGNGVFSQRPVQFTSGGPSSVGPTVLDADGSGQPELYTSNYLNQVVTDPSGVPPFGFFSELALKTISVASPFPVSSPIILEFTDRQNWRIATITGNAPPVVTVYIDEAGQTTTLSPVPLPADYRYANIAGRRAVVSDLDGNGRTDLVISCVPTSEQVDPTCQCYPNQQGLVLLSNPDGSLGQASIRISDAGASPGSSVAVGPKAADMDGDGLPDLVWANFATTSIGVTKNLGGGNFAATTYYSAVTQPFLVAAGDINRDGSPDILVYSWDIASAQLGQIGFGNENVYVLYNDGQGHLTAPQVVITVCQEWGSVGLADLNGDGVPDMYGAGHIFSSWVSLNRTPPFPCPGDVNGDRIVNSFDLARLLSTFGTTVQPGTGADITGDGTVNTFDLAVLLSHFGVLCPH